MSIASKLKKLREIRGLRQAELAEKAHVSTGMICDIEKGRAKNPSIEVIKKLSGALGVSPMYFVDEKATIPFDIKEVDEAITPELRELILKKEFLPYLMLTEKAYREKIPPHVLTNIIESLKDMASKRT